LLTGPSPFAIRRRTSFDGNERRVTQKDSKFSLLADKPGAFAITSISHQRDQCRTPVTDIVRRVHALPSARVRAGDRYVETVEEGEQAEIVFAFEGEPPFSFTYTRSTSGRLPTVLETHVRRHHPPLSRCSG
jgi:nucleoporin POM152